MAVSKRLRFEIFRRDNHACRYCGAAAPEAKLTIDHVVPTTLGGSDESSNLVTACADCNSGKTSASPDSTIVADVTADTIRWSQAMKAAVDAAMADRAAIAEKLEEFEEAWESWSYGPNNDPRPVPKPANWEESVRSFLAAGLPMPLLLDAVKTAMGRQKVKPEDTFRYMCGIAWRTVDDLREQAHSVLVSAAPQSESETAEPTFDLATQILGFLDVEETEEMINRERQAVDDAGDHIGTPAQRAAFDAFIQAVMDRSELSKTVSQLVHLDPGCELYKRLDLAEQELRVKERPTRPSLVLIAALKQLVRERSSAFLADLPPTERAEWESFARNLHGPDPFDKDRYFTDDDDLAVYAAECARAIASGYAYSSMCGQPGEHISSCPRRAMYRATRAQCHACTTGGNPGHRHEVCEEHVDDLLALIAKPRDPTPPARSAEAEIEAGA